MEQFLEVLAMVFMRLGMDYKVVYVDNDLVQALTSEFHHSLKRARAPFEAHC
jgi:hypothetical protein